MNNDATTRRDLKSPTGTTLHCRSWLTEAPFRMLRTTSIREVAEHPDELVVYGGIGRAARSWKDLDRILDTLHHAARR